MLHQTTQALIARGSSPTEAASQATGVLYGLLGRQSALLAYMDDFWIMAVAILVMVPLLLLMKKTRTAKGELAVH
jgi:DHA2 family multidrug resistance protein